MKKTKDIVLISIYVVLTIVLDITKTLIPFLNMPSGGSVNIALIPLTISSFHLGVKKGLLVGFLWFLISSLLGLNFYFVSFFQIIFDYIIPSIIMGGSAIFIKKNNLIEIESGIILMMFIRIFSICLSGALFWCEGEVSGSLNAWIFSLTYNLPYLIVTLVMLVIVIPILLKTLKKYLYNY